MKKWKTKKIKGDHRALEKYLNEHKSPAGFNLAWILPAQDGWTLIHIRSLDLR